MEETSGIAISVACFSEPQECRKQFVYGERIINLLTELLDATLYIKGYPILWREIIGNAFGFASAWGGSRRKMWAWPVGIVGNGLLFTVFMGGLFHTPQNLNLYGQAGRQLMFIAVSLYGWYRWKYAPSTGGSKEHNSAVNPRWATPHERVGLLLGLIVGVAACSWIFSLLDSWQPLAEAWIFVGSFLATYGMARGWTEFWLMWLGVDVVGVPLLLAAGFYPSAILYVLYGAFVVYGFTRWLKIQRAAEIAR